MRLVEPRGDIVFDHVWFAYQDEDWVLKDVTFRIAPGESIAFVGATGAIREGVCAPARRSEHDVAFLVIGMVRDQHPRNRFTGHDVAEPERVSV